MSLSAHISEKAALIWAIADKLTGVYKPHEYGEVILPLTVIRRFDCILADTKDAVLERYEAVKNLPLRDVLLRAASGKAFYNTSKYTFERLLDDPDNIEANFRDYLNGFSENVRDILEKFRFDGQIATLAGKGILYIVIKEFTTPKANLHPDVISNLEMGYIFEEIIRRFSESHNEDAGQHYTPREVIRLMVNLLFYDDNDILSGANVAKTIYELKVAVFGPQLPCVGPLLFLGHFPKNVGEAPTWGNVSRLWAKGKPPVILSAFADKIGWRRGYHVCRNRPKNGGCIMKMFLALILILCLTMASGTITIAEEAMDFSSYSDADLLELLADVQSEVAVRKIEKTAHLTAGTYIGGRDIPVGSYILATDGVEGEYGIVSLRSVNDPEDDYPSKLYEFKNGEDVYSVFITVEEGDTLILPFPYALTISGGVMFK